MIQRKDVNREHRCYWLDSEHTQFLYWIHQEDGKWKAMIIIPDKDMPREVLDEIADSYHGEMLNDRYQNELVDPVFLIKRISFEKGFTNGDKDRDCMDPLEEIIDPLSDILDAILPESMKHNAEMMEKFRWVLEQLQPQQVQLLYDHFLLNKSLQQIADEENAKNGTNIRRQAITNRMDKIYVRIEKLMPEYGATKPRVNFRKKDV